MIHVLDYNDNIIDYISKKNNYVTHANLVRSKEEQTDTYDFIIDSDGAANMRERKRIIVQDRNGIYREYIIVNVTDDIDDLTTVQCNASYVEDLTTAKPYAPGGFTKFTTTQAIDDITKDTGWECASDTEYGGVRTSTWTSYQTRYAVLQQMCTTYDMELDFYIELSSNTVAHRYVSLKSKNSLFKGKEIIFGKDLLSMSRTVDITEIHTALYAIGPESETGERLEIVVTDDDAQEQFGLDKRYIWGIYEPESDDAAMTKERLTTLARTQLNKDKQAAVSYEITSTDITNVYPHEVVNFGDTVRIKDLEFNPPLYVEAEVIGETYDPIANESTFTFGNVKEFKESELRKDLYDRLASIQQKMNDNITNVNTIVADVVAGQLEYFERKIIKSATPPENPVNDMLWYDTSNPEVAVLRRYWNGEWVEETADDVEKIGGITREKALFSELTNTFINLTIQHSRLQSDVYEVVSNEYLIDDDIRAKVNIEFNKTATTYNNIKSNLDSMTPETATIGKLVDTQAMFLNYREQLQILYNAVQNAQRAIDARFKLLQSQYTDEKFNDAMTQIAAALPNGKWDSESNQLLGDIPSKEELAQLQNTIIQFVAGQIGSLSEALNEETDYKINIAKNEINAGITSIKKEINGLDIGGTNLLENSSSIKKNIDEAIGGYNQLWRLDITHVHNKLKLGDTITISFDVQMERGDYLQVYDTNLNYGFSFKSQIFNDIGNNKQRLSLSKPLVDTTKTSEIWCLDFYNGHNGDRFTIENIKIEKGNIATGWSKAPEDVQNQIDFAKQQATDAAKAYADAQDELQRVEAQAYADGVVDAEEQRAIQDATDKLTIAKEYAESTATDAKNAAITDATNKINPITTRVTTAESNIQVLKDGLKLTATKTEVQQTLDEQLQPVKNQVNEQKAALDVLPAQISSKVSQATYDTDKDNIVSRLNSADTERVQLSNSIADKVTLKEYTDGKQATTEEINNAVNDIEVGTRNLIKNSNFLEGITNWRNVGDTTTDNTVIEDTSGALPNNFTKYATYTSTVADKEKGIAQNLIDVEIGKEYILSAWIKHIDGDNNVRMQMGRTSWTRKEIQVTNEWQRYEYKFIAHETPINAYFLKRLTIPSSTIAVTGVQLVRGNLNSDYKPSDKDTDQKLMTMATSIEQNGQQIELKASTTEMNASKKTLSSVIADLTINTTTGLSLTYDDNGAISSHVVDKNGVKIRGDKVDIVVNKEFQVLAGNVDNKVGKDEVVNRLNLSPEGLDINVNRIGIRGGEKSVKYVDIRNDKIELGGSFTSIWRGVTATDPVYTRLQNGHLRIRNDSKNASLYYTFNGISTYADGEGESGGSSGTIAWWDPSYSPSGANGITINSYGGVAALTSGLNRTMIQSRASVNLESMRSPVFIRPNKSYVGNSTFTFTTSTGDTNNANVKGYLMFGDNVNDDIWQYYSGFRFYKGKPYIEVVDSDFSAGGNTVLDAGNIMTNSIFKRNGSTTVYWNGTSSGTINDGVLPLDNQLVATSMVTNRGDKNMYIGSRGGGSILITDEHGFNSGKGQSYSGIGAARFTNMSLESLKTDIEVWNYDALTVLTNETQIYQYKLKNDVANGGGFYNRGLVIGDGYETPAEFRNGDGVNLYEMSSWQIRAIQQLNEKLEEQNKVIKQLEEQINE